MGTFLFLAPLYLGVLEDEMIHTGANRVLATVARCLIVMAVRRWHSGRLMQRVELAGPEAPGLR